MWVHLWPTGYPIGQQCDRNVWPVNILLRKLLDICIYTIVCKPPPYFTCRAHIRDDHLYFISYRLPWICGHNACLCCHHAVCLRYDTWLEPSEVNKNNRIWGFCLREKGYKSYPRTQRNGSMTQEWHTTNTLLTLVSTKQTNNLTTISWFLSIVGWIIPWWQRAWSGILCIICLHFKISKKDNFLVQTRVKTQCVLYSPISTIKHRIQRRQYKQSCNKMQAVT